ncbi:MAG: hypothetical protein EKK48_30515 [Candidatus Melainabacteria bacterium]|nr:MAG: hypothetical protein EKK48_30515 [Candidatus Melainabacteria bacterium]
MATVLLGHSKITSLVAVALLVGGSLGGCAKIELSSKKPSTTATTTAATSTSPTTQANSSPPGQMQAGQVPTSVAGDWKVGFQFNTSTLNSTFHLDQVGQTFKGTGTDDQDGNAFTIEKGTVANGQVHFFKQYQGNPPVEYSGKLEIQDDATYHGPYMSGDYTTASNGKIISNIWEAQMILPNNGLAGAPPPDQAPPNQAPPPDQQAPQQPERTLLSNWPADRAPHLSGKWDVGYEYNFKTMRSSMFIEQDGDRITGHGVDLNTKEKFTIEKGWYHYPKITIIRKYTKGKNQASSSRTMAFKASVSFVNDKDYQGPYMSGKTQGGGNWEAQRVE